MSYVSSDSAVPRTFLQMGRDVIALTKPRITAMVLFTCMGGYWLAARFFHQSVSTLTTTLLLLGMGLVVGGANALNMWIERDSDRLMTRTMRRPLPQGRLSADVALWVGIVLSAASLPILWFGVSAMTGLLAAVALLSYVLLYTPMKRVSPLALLVGAVPGAVPPLMGWSAARGTLDGPGYILFGIMFFWQIPHFLAIATFRKEEYAKAGLKVLPVVSGDRITRHHIIRYTGALVLTSLLLVPYGLGGPTYLYTAVALGALFAGAATVGLKRDAGYRWARLLFLTSMIYIVGMFVALSFGQDEAPMLSVAASPSNPL